MWGLLSDRSGLALLSPGGTSLLFCYRNHRSKQGGWDEQWLWIRFAHPKV